MNFIEKLKKFFKKPSQPATSSPAIPDTPENNVDNFDVIEQNAQKRIEEKDAAERRLTEYLAEENARKKEREKKLIDELNEKERIKEQEKKGLEERHPHLYARVKSRQKHDENIQKLTPEQRKEEREKAQRRREEERKIEQQKAEQRQLEQIAAEQRRVEEEQKSEQQRAEQKRLEEIKIREQKILERERLKQIHDLETNNKTYREYLIEAEKFRKEFGKNIKCDICGEWEIELFTHRGQTYCEKHIPLELHRGNEHKVRAGQHGAAQNFIKK